MPTRQDPISDPSAAPGPGRVAQRRRTRKAIVDAARQLIADGRTPSINDVAAAADVSRRTIYLYFPTVEQLLLDATTGLLSEAMVDEVLDAPGSDDVLERTDALARAMVRLAPDTLPLGRRIISLSVAATPSGEGTPRGHRRMEWIERAVAPLEERLSRDQHERLVSALSVLLGWEALIVLEDVRGLDAAAEEDVLRWMVRTVVEATLREAEEG